MNIALQGKGHKSFVFGFNDVKAKEDIQVLCENSDNRLKFQARIQSIKNVQLLSQSYHLENGHFLDINVQSKLISFEKFLKSNLW
ncbi:hypothetical protein AAID98_01230 [Campylobacter coli]